MNDYYYFLFNNDWTLSSWSHMLTIPVPIQCKKEKIELNIYFYTFLWCLNRFYEGLLHKTLEGTTKKCKNKNLSEFLFWYNFGLGKGRIKNKIAMAILKTVQVLITESCCWKKYLKSIKFRLKSFLRFGYIWQNI